MLMPTESAFNLMPVFGWPGFIPYHSRKRTRHSRGSTRPSVSKSSCTIAHHPTENGEAEPQSIERKRIHSLGTANGLMTWRVPLQQSKNAPKVTDQSPSSHAETSSLLPEARRFCCVGVTFKIREP